MNLRIFFLWLVIVSISFAQDLSPDYKQSAALGKRYDLMLDRQLSQYFQHGSYVIQTKVYLEEVLTPVEFENGARVFDGQDALPGLPVLPKTDSIQRYQDSLFVSRYRKDYELKYVDVNVIVDTKYSATDVAFILDFVKMTANLDAERGDRVQVSRRPFPKNPQDAALNPEQPIKLTDSLPKLPVSPALDSLKNTQINPSANSIIPWYFWLILGLLICTILFLILIRRKDPMKDSKQEQMNDLQNQITSLKNEAKTTIPPLPVDARSSAWKEARNYLINQMVGNPKTSGQIFQSWITSKGTVGIQQSVLALESLDYRLIRMFKNHIQPSELSQLELALQTFPGAEEEEKVKALIEFRKDFQSLSGQVLSDQQSDMFNFLEQMTVHQLKHLIADEASGIKAVVLAQVKPAIAAQILQDLEDKEKTVVLVNMGQIQNITVKAYKEIADRLSVKALSVSDMKFVASDGVESIINLVMDLPVNAQAGYIQSVAEQDLELAHRIRTFYVPFDELTQIDPKQLSIVLDAVDRDILALSLMRAEPEFVSSILEIYPERTRQMLLSSMEAQVEKTLSDVEAARKQLLLVARKEFARQGGVRR